jgi:hypothetical protein
MSRRYRSRGAASFVSPARGRVDPAEAEQRLAERDMREAADTRTEAQRWTRGSLGVDCKALTTAAFYHRVRA